MLLPPNTTAILQPVDVGINKPLKANIRSKFREFMFKNMITRTKKIGIKQNTFKNHDKDLIAEWILDSWPIIEKLNYSQSMKI